MAEAKKPITKEERLEAIRELLLAGTGPVAIAEAIGTSRPTANKLIKEARELFGLPEAAKLPPGDHQRVRKMKKLQAEGKSGNQIQKELQIGERTRKRLEAAAADSTSVAVYIDPEAVTEVVDKTFDILEEVNQSSSRLKGLAAQLESQVKMLEETTKYDVENLMGSEMYSGWHKRMGNFTKAVNTLRQVEETRLKVLQVYESVMDKMVAMTEINGLLTDIKIGQREALAMLITRGYLTISLEEALRTVQQQTRIQFAKRKGLTT